MNREELERILEEQANASRGKRGILAGIDRDRLRAVLNGVFLVLALAGVVTYFYADHIAGLVVIGISLVIKVLEFLVRFLL